MTTRMSRLFIQTLREAPSEARTRGQQLLTRAGLIRSVGGTGYAFLPMGVQARQKLLCRALDRLGTVGSQAIVVPAVQLLDFTGEKDAGVRFRDRSQRAMTLAAAHDRAVLALSAGVIQSYKQLPVLLHEAWEPYLSDEGGSAGLINTAQGQVLDGYGVHAEREGMLDGCQSFRTLLSQVCAEAADGVLVAECDGDASELIYPVDGGPEALARCPACGYAAVQSAARIRQEIAAEEPSPRADVATPDCKTIADLARYLNIPASRTAKVVFLVADTPGQGDRFVFAMVRGDTALNEEKLKRVLNAGSIGPASEDEIRAAGAEPGYGSPVGLSDATIVVDTLAANSPNLVAGANRPGYHAINVNHGRDYQATVVADIAMAQAGSPCPACGSSMVIGQGAVLARVWPAGEVGGEVSYLDRLGAARSAHLSRCRLYVDRLLAAAAESHSDEHGLAWPAAVAPYEVYLLTLGKAAPELTDAAERAANELSAAGISVLYDDRDERAGVKFNDADLIGAPVRIAIGDRGLKAGVAEVKRRESAEVEQAPLAELAANVRRLLA